MRFQAFCTAACLFVLLALAGCGSSSSVNPPPAPPAPQPSLSVISPADNATVRGVPVNLSVSATNLSDLSQLAILLNGSDITSKLKLTGQTWGGTVQSPDVNYGKNQIQVRYQDLRANSSFTFDTASSVSSKPGASPATLLVPIVTRVLRNNDPTVTTNWGVQVGGNTYWANATVNCSNAPAIRAISFSFSAARTSISSPILRYNVAGPSDLVSYSPFIQAS